MKKQMIKIIPFSALLIAINTFSQVKRVAPSVDTYIQSSSPNSSFSTDISLKIKHSISQSSERISWIKFPIGSFPDYDTQVILKLVKISGNEGNISLFGADENFSATSTWNSPPSTTSNFYYGGLRKGDTCFFDVTDYIQKVRNTSNNVGFKIFTNSVIVSPITFASSEASDIKSRPELIFYNTKNYTIPLFSLFETTTIPTENGDYTGELLDTKDILNEVRSLYGGWENAKSTATGFFRIERDCEKTWHIIDPDGYMFYSAGINSVEVGGDVSLPNDLVAMGLNTMGSWSDEEVKNFAYCPRFNVLVNFKNSSNDIKNTYNLEILPVFEPTFKSFCESLAQTELQPYLSDPWVLGYFLDNELLFHKNQLSLSLGLVSTNAQFIEADLWMKNKYGTNYSLSSITEDDELVYQGHVAEIYFKTVSEAFKTIDPNHMLIGTRIHANGKYTPLLFEAAGRYMDIISINYYNRFEPEEEPMDMWLTSAEKPFIITEFYTKGEDSGLGNVDGAGWNVPTQQDRANWYENWMLKLLRNKGNVGFHWFRYNDKLDNDANKGLYTSDYVLYETLAESFEKTCSSIYTLRSQILYGNYNYNDVIDCDGTICGANKPCDVVLSNESFEETEKTNSIFPNPSIGIDQLRFPLGTKKIELISPIGVTTGKITLQNLSNTQELNGIFQILCYNENDELLASESILILKN